MKHTYILLYIYSIFPLNECMGMEPRLDSLIKCCKTNERGELGQIPRQAGARG